MAISETVVVNIRINRGGHVAREVEDIGKRGQHAFSGWATELSTIRKALTSMFAVIIVWTALITIPEKLASAFFKLSVAAIEAADAFHVAVLSTAGLLSSFASFGPTIGQSFENAVRVSVRLQLVIAQLADETIGSAQDIALAFQTFVGRGGLSMTKSMEDAAEAAALLTQNILTLTQGQAKERQIASEISGIMQGQMIAGNVLTRLLRARVGDLDAWLQKARQTRNFTQMLREALPGLAESGKALGETMSGVLETIKGLVVIINGFVSQAGGAFQFILETLKEWRSALVGISNDILTAKGGFDSLKPSTQAILLDFMKFNESIKQVLIGLNALLKYMLGINEEASTLDSIADHILQTTIMVRALLENLTISTLVKLVASFGAAYIVVKAIVASIMGGVGIVAGITAALTALTGWLPLLGGIAALLAVLGFTLWPEINKATEESALDIEKMRVEFSKFMKDLQRPDAKFTPFPELEEDTDAIKKQLVNLRRELAMLQTGSNQFAQVWVRVQEKIADATIDMKNQPSSLAEALRLIREIGVEQTKQLVNTMIMDKGREEILFWDGEIAAAESVQAETIGHINIALTHNLALRDQILDNLMTSYRLDNEILRTQRQQKGEDFLNSILRKMPESNRYQSEFVDILEDQVMLFRELQKLRLTIGESGGEGHVLGREAEEAIRALTANRLKLAELLKLDPVSFEDSIKRYIVGLQSLGETLREVARTMLLEFGNSISNLFEDLVSGDGAINALRKFAATTINILADLVQAWGITLIQAGMADWIFGGSPNWGKIAAGIGLLAAAGVIRGLAGRVGGSGGGREAAGAGSASASGGQRQIFFQPTANLEALNLLKDTAERLHDVAMSFDSISPGEVVARGANVAVGRRAISGAMRKEMHSSSEVRTDITGAVFGEAT